MVVKGMLKPSTNLRRLDLTDCKRPEKDPYFHYEISDHFILVPALPKSSPGPRVVSVNADSIKVWIPKHLDVKNIASESGNVNLRGDFPFHYVNSDIVFIYYTNIQCIHNKTIYQSCNAK